MHSHVLLSDQVRVHIECELISLLQVRICLRCWNKMCKTKSKKLRSPWLSTCPRVREGTAVKKPSYSVTEHKSWKHNIEEMGRIATGTSRLIPTWKIQIPGWRKSCGNHTPISQVLICLLNSKLYTWHYFFEFRGRYLYSDIKKEQQDQSLQFSGRNLRWETDGEVKAFNRRRVIHQWDWLIRLMRSIDQALHSSGSHVTNRSRVRTTNRICWELLRVKSRIVECRTRNKGKTP